MPETVVDGTIERGRGADLRAKILRFGWVSTMVLLIANMPLLQPIVV